MKKIVLSLVALCATVVMSAQDDASSKPLRFGIKAGLNLSSVFTDMDAKFSTSMTAGFVGGAFASYNFNEKMGVQLEALYSMQGTNWMSSGESYTYEINDRFSYINVPILFKYSVIPNLDVLVGPQLGFMVSGKREDTYTETYNGKTSTSTETTDLIDKKIVNTFDFAGVLGADYNITQNIFAGLRYSYSFTDIFADQANSNSNDKTTNNSVLAISAGYKF